MKIFNRKKKRSSETFFHTFFFCFLFIIILTLRVNLTPSTLKILWFQKKNINTYPVAIFLCLTSCTTFHTVFFSPHSLLSFSLCITFSYSLILLFLFYKLKMQKQLFRTRFSATFSFCAWRRQFSCRRVKNVVWECRRQRSVDEWWNEFVPL